MTAMCEAGFDVIDLYSMTDSNPVGTPDGLHYPANVFDTVETLLERYKMNNNQRLGLNERKRRIRRCKS